MRKSKDQFRSVQLLSCVGLFVTPWTVALQVPLSMGFFRQEYWSGVPFSTPGDLPNREIKPTTHESPALAGGFFTTSTSKHLKYWQNICLT